MTFASVSMILLLQNGHMAGRATTLSLNPDSNILVLSPRLPTGVRGGTSVCSIPAIVVSHRYDVCAVVHRPGHLVFYQWGTTIDSGPQTPRGGSVRAAT